MGNADVVRGIRGGALKGPPLRCVVFDLDGTLIDSRRDLADSANELLVECGGRPLPEEAIGRMVGDGAATLVTRVFTAGSVPMPADALPRFLRLYDGRLVAYTRPYDGVEMMLEALRERYVLCLLTNKPLDATRRILQALRLDRFFDSSLVMGGDGPHPRKPDPEGLIQLAARTSSAAAETMLVGDSVIDWRTARGGGAMSCVARYGFGFAGFPVEELTGADAVIDSPAELIRIL